MSTAFVTCCAEARVFICSNDGCTAWTAITPAQLATLSTDGNKTSIQQTLQNSSEDSIGNGYNSIANTDLYLKKSLWHKGGSDPFAGMEHVTAYVYKSTNSSVRIKTCHAFSYRKTLTGPYFATCA